MTSFENKNPKSRMKRFVHLQMCVQRCRSDLERRNEVELRVEEPMFANKGTKIYVCRRKALALRIANQLLDNEKQNIYLSLF